MGVTRNQKVHPIKITEAAYKDVGSLVLESDALRVAIIPAYGSKMASLMHKRTGVEHLYQLPGKTFRRAAYGDSFERGNLLDSMKCFPRLRRAIATHLLGQAR